MDDLIEWLRAWDRYTSIGGPIPSVPAVRTGEVLAELDRLRRELAEARELLDEAEQWLGDNDDEESLARRIRVFLAESPIIHNYPENNNSAIDAAMAEPKEGVK